MNEPETQPRPQDLPLRPMSDDRPSLEEITRYLAGTLSDTRFEAIDAYLGTLDEDEAGHLLEAAAAQGDDAELPAQADEPETDCYRSTGRHRFEVSDHVASGGMGRIELAHDRVLDRDVALKRCHPRAPQEAVERHQERRRRFRQEALITARLEHPSIVPVHDVGQDEFGEPTMVLKHLEGAAFDRYLERATSARQRHSEGLRILMHVCEALAYAHAQGIVHRDLKPENIVIGRYGSVAVIDWGLAAMLTDRPMVDPIDRAWWCGTPGWMPPEQASGARPDPRADVWSIGALLAFVTTKCPPRQLPGAVGPSGPVDPVDPDDLPLEGLPRSLRAVVKRCLAKDPSARYSDAAAVLADLRRWQVEGITNAERAGPVRRLLALMRRHRSVAIGTAVVVGCLGLILLSQLAHHLYHIRHTRTLVERMRQDTPILDLNAVEAALTQLEGLREQYGDLPEIHEAQSHFRAVAGELRTNHDLEGLRRRLDAIERHQRVFGPQADQIAERLAVLHEAGSAWPDPGAGEALARHPLREALLQNVAALAGLLLIYDRDHDLHDHRDHDAIHRVLRRVDPVGPWAAVGQILDRATVQPHDLYIPPDLTAALETALRHPPAADLLLALIAPDALVCEHAKARIRNHPAAFWPRLILARSALMAGDTATARRHALVAHGRMDDSILPLMLLAYAELLDGDHETLAERLDAIEGADPGNIEAAIIAAASLATRDREQEARALLDQPAIAAHLALHKRNGHHTHPMDLALELLHRRGIHSTH